MSAKTKPAPQPEPAATNLVQLSIPTPAGDAAQEAMTAMAYVESFTIANASDSAKGQEVRARLNTRIKALNDARMLLTRPIDVAKKTIMDFFAGPVQVFEKAKNALDQKILAYENEQERLRRIEQARLDKIADDERRRLQAIADEAKRKADADAAEKRKQAEAAAAAGRAADAARLMAQAQRVEEKADAKVETFETRASSVIAPIAQAQVASVAGVGFREVPEYEIIDPEQINKPFMSPDDTKIGKVVRSLGLDAVGVVGNGLKVTMKKILASRRT